MTDRIPNQETPCTHGASDSQCNSEQITQCIITYAAGMYRYLSKSVLRHKFLIQDTHRPETVYLLEQECDGLWLFWEAKRDSRAKGLENSGLICDYA